MRNSESAPLARRSDLLPHIGRDPFWAFRHEVDRLFDNFLAPAQFGQLGAYAFHPVIDMTENDDEICLRAELPGVDERDVEIKLDGDMLTLRGEKRDERTDESETHRMVERAYGSFERTVELPFTPAEGGVKAKFRNGVLTVTAKKPPELAKAAKRIPIGNA